MPAASSSSSSFPGSSCFGAFFGRGGCGFSGSRAPAMAPPPFRGAPRPGCGGSRLDRAVAWVGNGVAAAFFASLERCSCVNIATDDDRDEARDVVAPLIHDDGNAAARGDGRIRRRSGKGKGGFDF